MSKLAKGRKIIKIVTPEQMCRYVAEGVLVRQGIDLNGVAKVQARFYFTRGNAQFQQCRVEVEGV